MRLFVCGGRDFVNADMLNKALTALKNKHQIDFLFHGGASGADELADQWAKRMGIPHCRWDACWTYYGKGAGPKRNEWMISFMEPAHCVAFPGGKGTAGAIELAKLAGAKVWEVGK